MIILFLACFALYLATLFPGLAPYRDSGEMVSVIHTLGIAHPPGYPLYVLSGKVFSILMPFGAAAYRLNVMSAVFSALTAAVIYFVFLEFIRGADGRRTGFALAAGAAAVAATSYLQWYLSLVSEMYTLNTFFAALLILLSTKYFLRGGAGGAAYEAKILRLMSFITGLGAGNRMDIILLAAGLLGAAYLRETSKRGLRALVVPVLFLLAGLSVYLFLPFRSSLNPVFDWNHPASFDKLLSTISRRTHGGTLDLLSRSYAGGTNFFAGILFYLRHLFGGFAYVGVLLGALGIYASFRKNIYLAWGLLIGFVISCPVFIYMSNMPPNPHALTILEAHFIMPNVIFAVWFFLGVEYAISIARFSGKQAAFAAVCAVLAVINLASNYRDLNKRSNFFDEDYSRNVFSSLPAGAIVVLKEDVQLFSTWNRRFVMGKRQDLAPVGQGLSGSKWYAEMMARTFPDISLNRLDTEDDWKMMIADNPRRPLYFTADVESPGFKDVKMTPAGLASAATLAAGAPENAGALLDEVYVYRGRYEYDSYREFFTPDLIEDYAKAFYAAGYTMMMRGDYAGAGRRFLQTLAQKRTFPIAAFNLGYINFVSQKYTQAKDFYIMAKGLYEETIKLADEYNALPDIREKFRQDASDVCVHLGVTSEKLGSDEDAMRFYSEALSYNPASPRAHYNMAVIYWKKRDWDGAIREFENALRIDPGFAEARYFLQKAIEMKNK
jgi:tetratricopeptide (TPR) repeat protein